MKIFMRSLTGEALTWYIEQDTKKIQIDTMSDFMRRFGFNINNAPYWFCMYTLKKNLNNSFREYAIRWRSEAARAWTPIE